MTLECTEARKIGKSPSRYTTNKNKKNTKRIELEDCGHLIPIEKPQEFADYINKFVKNLI